MPRSLLACLLAAAALAAPATAAAADALVVSDAAAGQVSALDGTLVWVSGDLGAQRLMRRGPDGTMGAVEGAPVARSYPSIDLGHNSDGSLLLTYRRCDATGPCKVLWNDLDGRRATFRGLAPRGCALSTTVSQWRATLAYGLSCTRHGRADDARGGLWVQTRGRAPRHLRRPRDAVRFGARSIAAVDIRGNRVAALAAGIYEYAFSQTTTGRDPRSIFAAASEGDGDGHVRAIALGGGGTLWALADAEHLDDPKESIVFRLAGSCLRAEDMRTPATGDFAAVGLAVDGAALYLVAPGAGIVSHAFTPGALPGC